MAYVNQRTSGRIAAYAPWIVMAEGGCTGEEMRVKIEAAKAEARQELERALPCREAFEVELPDLGSGPRGYFYVKRNTPSCR